MIPLYVHGNSCFHRMNPGLKLLFLLVAGTTLFFVNLWWCLAIALAFVPVLYWLAGIHTDKLCLQIVPMLWLFGLVFVGHAVFTSWLSGVIVVLRLMLLFSLAGLVTMTTRMTEMIVTIVHISQPLVRPLEKYGLKPDRLGMMLSLTLRYIPLIMSRYTELRDAQHARCARAGTLTLVFPLLVQSLRLADQLAEAIDARAYDTDPAPGHLTGPESDPAPDPATGPTCGNGTH